MINLDIKKRLGNLFLEVNFKIPLNSITSIIGASGAGKSSILNMIAGFLLPDSGVISIKDKVLFDKKTFIKPQNRNIGYLFQDYALFPHLNVINNLLYAKNDLLMAKELLNRLDLKDKEEFNIKNLSGGEKQRVALARSLMLKPKILLLDEPFNALDSKTREKLYEILIDIKNSFNMTIVLLSHDLIDIYSLSDFIFVLEDGKIKEFKIEQNKENISAKVISHSPTSTNIFLPNQIITLPSNPNLKVGDNITLGITK